MYKKHEWPFVRTAVFLKPEEDFNLAIGFKSYNHAPNADLAQSPSETIFDLDGNVLYSGLGLTDGKIKFEFLSQADKKIISKLPTSDPRYDRAVQFAISNHYFFEDEIPEFKIRLTGKDFLPSDFKIIQGVIPYSSKSTTCAPRLSCNKPFSFNSATTGDILSEKKLSPA